MFQRMRRSNTSSKGKMPSGAESPSLLRKPLSAIAVPGMYLFYKYSEFKRQQQEIHRKKVTEKELDHLNHKIDKLLAKIDDRDGDQSTTHKGLVPSSPSSTRPMQPTQTSCQEDEECVICMSAKATMQTFPCGHKVICRKCFIKTIQVAVSQRCLPLTCVICRTRILKLRQAAPVKVPSTTTKGQKSRTPSGYSRFTKQSKVYAK